MSVESVYGGKAAEGVGRLGGSLASIAALAIPAANAARIGPASTTLHRRRLHCPTLHLPGKAPSTCITPEFCRLPRKILLNSSLDQKVIPKFQMVFRSPWWYTLWRRSTCCCFRPATNPMVKDFMPRPYLAGYNPKPVVRVAL
jgi:hypothetical protein